MATSVRHMALKTAAAAAVATASKSTHAAGVATMRAELVVYALLASAGAATAEAVQAPDFATKAIMIVAGTLLGTVAAAFTVPNASVKQRAARGLLSISAGPVFAYIALAFWPENSRFDPREWILVVAATTSYFAWLLVRWIQKRRGAIEARLDDVADGVGLPRVDKAQGGRSILRFILVLLVLSLLAAAVYVGWFILQIAGAGH